MNQIKDNYSNKVHIYKQGPTCTNLEGKWSPHASAFYKVNQAYKVPRYSAAYGYKCYLFLCVCFCVSVFTALHLFLLLTPYCPIDRVSRHGTLLVISTDVLLMYSFSFLPVHFIKLLSVNFSTPRLNLDVKHGVGCGTPTLLYCMLPCGCSIYIRCLH